MYNIKKKRLKILYGTKYFTS